MLTAGTWRSPSLLVATGTFRRLRGIRAAPPGWGILLRAASIHTIGLDRPLACLGLDRRGVVRWARVVQPGRVAGPPGTVWVAEFPPGPVLPERGWRLAAYPAQQPAGPIL